jgi:hypothetical protein
MEIPMLFRSYSLFVPIILLSFQAASASVLVDYGVTNLGSGEYLYDYSIFNDGSLGAGVPIQLLDISFDSAMYQGPSIVTPNPPASQWSQMILNSVGRVPMAYDVLALDGGIPVGSTVSGFAVQFDWLGQGLPGPQQFQIYDSGTFALLQSGETTSNGPAPEPSTFGMLAIVLAYGARKIWLIRSPRPSPAVQVVRSS